jgi:hypothetical protein
MVTLNGSTSSPTGGLMTVARLASLIAFMSRPAARVQPEVLPP